VRDEVVADPSGTPSAVVRVEHAYDVGGLPTWRHESLMQAKNPAVCWSQEYTHDTLGRLTRARRGQVNGWAATPTLETTSPAPCTTG
jgi:hypothetical protein